MFNLKVFFPFEVFNLGIQKIPHELDLGPGWKGGRGNPDQRGG